MTQVQNSKNPHDVNPSFTSDGAERSNLMSRDEFVKLVLHSGQITRIAQHLALVVFLAAEGKNQLNMSIRDLQKITGWSRPAIKDHLAELEVFMRITLGGGRAKALFELQGVIEDVMAGAVVAGSRAAKLPQPKLAAKEVATSFAASQPAARLNLASQPAASNLVAAHVAAGVLAAVGVASPVMASEVAANPLVVASQPATSAVVASLPPTRWEIPASASAERERVIYTSNNNLSLNTTPRANEKAAEEEDPVKVNGVAIHGPDFKIDLKAVDLAAGTIGMPSQLGRDIAEICARGWAASGEKPRYPMAAIKAALMNHHNQVQVNEVKLDKSRADTKPKESRAARLLRHVEQAADKGGRQ